MFCSGCGKQIQDEDAFCRFCGLPTKASEVNSPAFGAQDPRQVTVKNPYRGKDQMILGGLVFVVGLIWLIAASVSNGSNGPSWSVGIAALVTIAGIVIYLAGRFEHWYHSG